MCTVFHQHFPVAADPLYLKDQKILQISDLRRLSADTEFGASLSVCRLLTLVAEHLIV
mgnify:CR=1 FL=1